MATKAGPEERATDRREARLAEGLEAAFQRLAAASAAQTAPPVREEAKDWSGDVMWKRYVVRTDREELRWVAGLAPVIAHAWRRVAAAVRRMPDTATQARRLEALPGKEALVAALRTASRRLLPGTLELGWDEGSRRLEQARGRGRKAAAPAKIPVAAEPAFDLALPRLAAYLDERPRRYAADVSDTLIDRMRRELIEGVAEGESIDDLAERILDLGEIDAPSRARRIARTEVISGSNAATHEHYAASGVVEGKEWATAGDERVRDAHVEANGQVVAIDESFEVDGEELEFPGDPNGEPGNVINCRCTLLPVLADARERGWDAPVRREFDESAHPRDDAGKFTEGGGGGGGDTEWPAGSLAGGSATATAEAAAKPDKPAEPKRIPFIPASGVSPIIYAQARVVIDDLPDHVKTALSDKGVVVHLVPKMKPDKLSKISDTRVGFYNDLNREIVVAVENARGDKTSDINKTLTHELGHAVDHAFGRPSQSLTFKRLWKQGFAKLNATEKARAQYYNKKSREGFAELWAHANGKSSNSMWVGRDRVENVFKEAIAYVKEMTAP